MANQFIGRSWQPINKEIKKETHHIDTTKPLILGCIWEAILKSLEGHWETQASHFAARVIIWKKIPITTKWDHGISRFLCKRVIFVSHIEDQWPMQCRMIMMRATPEQVDSRWCWWLTWAGRIQISCRASGYLVAIAALRTSSWAGKQWCVLRIAQNKTIHILSFWELETIEPHKMDDQLGPISWWVLCADKNRLLVTVERNLL